MRMYEFRYKSGEREYVHAHTAGYKHGWIMLYDADDVKGRPFRQIPYSDIQSWDWHTLGRSVTVWV